MPDPNERQRISTNASAPIMVGTIKQNNMKEYETKRKKHKGGETGIDANVFVTIAHLLPKNGVPRFDDSSRSNKSKHDDVYTKQPDYTGPFFAPAPAPDDIHSPYIILRIGHTRDEEFHLIQLRHSMRNASLTNASQLWD